MPQEYTNCHSFFSSSAAVTLVSASYIYHLSFAWHYLIWKYFLFEDRLQHLDHMSRLNIFLPIAPSFHFIIASQTEIVNLVLLQNTLFGHFDQIILFIDSFWFWVRPRAHDLSMFSDESRVNVSLTSPRNANGKHFDLS